MERNNKWTRTANRVKCAKFRKRHSFHRITKTTTTTKKRRQRENEKKEWSRAQACWAVTSLAPFAWKKEFEENANVRFFFALCSFDFSSLLFGFGCCGCCSTIVVAKYVRWTKKSSRWLVYWLFPLKKRILVFVLFINCFQWYEISALSLSTTKSSPVISFA